MQEEIYTNTETDQESQPEMREEKKKKPVRRTMGCLGRILTAGILIGGGFLGGRVYTIIHGAGPLAKINAKLNVLQVVTDQYFLHDYDAAKLEDSIYAGYMSGLGDKYTCYYSAKEYNSLLEQDSGKYKGIGITVYKDPVTNYVYIESVTKGAPAEEAGIQNGDFIVSVDDKDVTDLTLTEVVDMIKSDETEEAKIGIYRESEKRLFDVTVQKTEIDLETVSYEMKEDKTGYISVTSFLENTDEKFIEAVDALEAEGMKGLIIDLRSDGGGLLDSCVNMLSYIIPKDQLLVYTQDKKGEKYEISSNSDHVLDIPIVILVNEYSASASEIFTGCLKDYKKATIVGTKTYGKGVVQSVLPLGDGSAIKITTSEYFTPEGYEVDQNGIQPDVEVEITDEEVLASRDDEEKDPQLTEAKKVLRELY